MIIDKMILLTLIILTILYILIMFMRIIIVLKMKFDDLNNKNFNDILTNLKSTIISKMNLRKLFYIILILFIIISIPYIVISIYVILVNDMTDLFSSIIYLNGNIHLYYDILYDLFGSILLIFLVYRIIKLVQINAFSLKNQNNLILFSVIIIILTFFFLGAILIAITNYPKYTIYSPIRYFIALFLKNINTSLLTIIHYIIWWINKLTIITFIILTFHIFSDYLIQILNKIYITNSDELNS